MREQIRLWFYSQLFMSVVLVGRAPFKRVLGYEKMRDEHGHEMHGSWGNMIDAVDAFERMGADVMRWQYCAQPPDRDLLFGFGPAHEIKRKLLTLWNSIGFLVQYANIGGWGPDVADLERGPAVEAVLDRWLVARTHEFVRAAEEAYEATLTVDLIRAFETFLDDLSNWYIRRSRARFWRDDAQAFGALWYALVQSLRAVAPVMPFLADHVWANLVRGREDSVFLAGWPEVAEPDHALLAEIAEVRRVVELGRQARSTSGIKLRQPLRRLVVEGASLDGHSDEVADELRVKSVELGTVEAVELRVKPNLPVLGPKLGKELATVREALQRGEFELDASGRVSVAGHVLDSDEVLVERGGREGWAVASADGVTVALDLGLDDELLLEGEAYELIHLVNSLRKERGFELTDRILLTLPAADRELADRHGEWIAREVLATEIRVSGDELQLEKS
jgi:isoleucyl-tRNA synthetase